MRSKKLIIPLILGLLIVGGIFFGKSKQQAKLTPAGPLKQAVAKKGNLVLQVESTATVTSNLDVEIKCKASGEVRKLPFDVSDSVKKGDLLVELDPIDEERKVKQAKVSLSSAIANLAKANAVAEDAKTKAERMKELLEKKLCSQEDYETAKSTKAQAVAGLQQAGSQVSLAELDLSDARQRLDDTKVVAPMNGVVAERNVQVGQIISSGINSVSGGTTILTLSDLSHIFVMAAVDESDIGRVKVEQEVLVAADAFPGKKFLGKVVRIATQGINTSNVVTFDVKIEVTSPHKSLLKPGMTTDVEVVTAKRENVVLVPNSAVYRQEEKQLVEVVKPDDSTEEREVKVGETDGMMIEIIEGLVEGESVVLKPGNIESKWQRGSSGRMMGMRIMRRASRRR